jgi:hypothetical protein
LPTLKGGLNISIQIIYVNCAEKKHRKDNMENKDKEYRQEREYLKQRMSEERMFNKVYLPNGGLEAELNFEEENEI